MTTEPETITTAAELDALPTGTVILDSLGAPLVKRLDGEWSAAGDEFDSSPDSVASHGPLIVIHIPPKPEPCPEWPFSFRSDDDGKAEVMIPAWGLKDGDMLSTPDGWQPVSDVFAERDDYISFDLTGHRHVLTTFDTLVVRRG